MGAPIRYAIIPVSPHFTVSVVDTLLCATAFLNGLSPVRVTFWEVVVHWNCAYAWYITIRLFQRIRDRGKILFVY